jgi:two-component system sensor histidine kinase PilS (NtrC family)
VTDTELRRKVGWLIGIRAVISTLLLGGATLAQITSHGSLPGDPFFWLIAATYALTLVYALTLRLAPRNRWLIDVQLAADAVIVSAFIYFTGGITSLFASLYALPIIAASTVRFRRGAIVVAGISAVLYLGVTASQYLANELPPRPIAQYIVALNVFGFFGVALLSGSLAEGMRSAGARLARASSEIADLQALNQHVIDSLPSGLVTTDPARRILTFNHAAETITGLPAARAVDRPLADVLQLPPAVCEALDRGMADVRRLEVRYSTADGRGDIDLGLGITHLRAIGDVPGLLVTFQDVTDFKRLEHEVRMQQRLAAVGEMAAGIAHEIRNPLASMSGSIQILRQELPLSAEQDQLMDIVLRESERLNATIRSFLAYARPQRFAIARFDMRRALNDTALLLRNSAEVSEGHTIEVDVPAVELWYEADEGQIKQIIWNLATNGLRAMPDGGRLKLKGSYEAAESVAITVQDDGIGIPAGELDGLFQPFHGSFAKGAGLGLAIVHRIVTDYNGEIQVSSRPGAGTTVSVRLPARAEVTA